MTVSTDSTAHVVQQIPIRTLMKAYCTVLTVLEPSGLVVVSVLPSWSQSVNENVGDGVSKSSVEDILSSSSHEFLFSCV